MSTGFMMAIMVVFLVLAPALRRAGEKHQLVTPGDYIRLRFGEERTKKKRRKKRKGALMISPQVLLTELCPRGRREIHTESICKAKWTEGNEHSSIEAAPGDRNALN